MASDPYAVYNQPGNRYNDQHTEPVYNPYSYTSGHDDTTYNDNDHQYVGYRDDTFVPPAANAPVVEKPLPNPSRNTSYSTQLPRE